MQFLKEIPRVGHRGLGREGADDDAAGYLTCPHFGEMTQVRHGLRDGTRLGKKRLPRRGEIHDATGALDQLKAEPPFQHTDLLTEGGL